MESPGIPGRFSIFFSNDFSQLLQGPLRIRVRRDIEMRQPARAMVDDHEDVKKPERGADRHKEVTRNDRLGVIP